MITFFSRPFASSPRAPCPFPRYLAQLFPPPPASGFFCLLFCLSGQAASSFFTFFLSSLFFFPVFLLRKPRFLVVVVWAPYPTKVGLNFTFFLHRLFLLPLCDFEEVWSYPWSCRGELVNHVFFFHNTLPFFRVVLSPSPFLFPFVAFPLYPSELGGVKITVLDAPLTRTPPTTD